MSGTERIAGELERFAIDSALRDAWVSEFWAPGDPDFGFVDYFEAAAARNFGLLGGLEELAENIDRRGIVPKSDSKQARLVTDGGDGRLIAEWQERPYTAHDRQRATVYHRVMLYVYDHGVDIEHQAKGDEQAAIPPEWNPVNVWEVRNGRVSKLRRQEVLRS